MTLARYGVRSGYSHYRAIADDLFTSNTAKPNLEFIMELSQDAIKAMTSSMSLENIILAHLSKCLYGSHIFIN